LNDNDVGRWFTVHEPLTLRQWREAKLLKQAHVASRLGICRSALCMMEKGQRNVSLKHAIGLAEIYGCTERDIFYAAGVHDSSTTL
jgi:DNA-binding XRE family transcriptional regulator